MTISSNFMTRSHPIGIKGFDKDLKCRGFKYEIGKTYKINEKPNLCKIGFHYCKTFNDVITYYPDIKNNRFCIVEILGDIDDGVGKSCTNVIKIREEVCANEIKSFNPLSNLDLLYALNKSNYIIGGSAALIIAGYPINRTPHDLDLITSNDNNTINKHFIEFKSHKPFSGADISHAFFGLFNERYDIIQRKDPDIFKLKRFYNGVECVIEDPEVIWNYKLKYAMNGNLKHMNDINKCGLKPKIDIGFENKTELFELPF